MLQCMEILSIATEKEIRIFAVKGNWQLNDSIQSKVLAMAFTMAAEIVRLLNERSTQRYIAGQFNTSPTNLSRWMKKHGLRRNKG